MEFAQPLIFSEKSPEEAKKILRERRRKITEVPSSSLRLLNDNSKLTREHRNGDHKIFPVRESFYY